MQMTLLCKHCGGEILLQGSPRYNVKFRQNISPIKYEERMLSLIASLAPIAEGH